MAARLARRCDDARKSDAAGTRRSGVGTASADSPSASLAAGQAVTAHPAVAVALVSLPATALSTVPATGAVAEKSKERKNGLPPALTPAEITTGLCRRHHSRHPAGEGRPERIERSRAPRDHRQHPRNRSPDRRRGSSLPEPREHGVRERERPRADRPRTSQPASTPADRHAVQQGSGRPEYAGPPRLRDPTRVCARHRGAPRDRQRHAPIRRPSARCTSVPRPFSLTRRVDDEGVRPRLVPRPIGDRSLHGVDQDEDHLLGRAAHHDGGGTQAAAVERMHRLGEVLGGHPVDARRAVAEVLEEAVRIVGLRRTGLRGLRPALRDAVPGSLGVRAIHPEHDDPLHEAIPHRLADELLQSVAIVMGEPTLTGSCDETFRDCSASDFLNELDVLHRELPRRAKARSGRSDATWQPPVERRTGKARIVAGCSDAHGRPRLTLSRDASSAMARPTWVSRLAGRRQSPARSPSTRSGPEGGSPREPSPSLRSRASAGRHGRSRTRPAAPTASGPSAET